MKNTESKKYKGFSLKERLLPSILLALAAPLTIFIFGPIDIFANNIAEFGFVLSDFIFWNILFSLICSAVLCGILILLRGIVFDVVYSVLFGISLMLFIQGCYLNIGMQSLGADAADSATTPTVIVITTIVWVLISVGSVLSVLLIKKKHIGTVKLVSEIALVAILSAQLITFVTQALTTDAFISYEDKTSADSGYATGSLTYKNITSVSKNKNVVYFVVDCFGIKYYEAALKQCPEIFDDLDGFTAFLDNTTLYSRTFPGTTYMLTGIEIDHDKYFRAEYFDHAYANSEFLKAFIDNNYRINIYTDSYTGYENTDVLSEYTENARLDPMQYTVDSKIALAWDMVQISLYRYLPFVAKGMIKVTTPELTAHLKYEYETEEPKYTTDMRDLYLHFKNNEFTTYDDDKNNFSFIHISGTHTPYRYDENFEPATDKTKVNGAGALKQSFTLINHYINEMKKLGVYEDATIIITGDHASLLKDHDDPLEHTHTVPLFVKPSGSSDGEYKTSQAQVSHTDLFDTILKSENITAKGYNGRSVFEIPETEQRTRRYLFHRWNNGGFNLLEIKIRGASTVYKNWDIPPENSGVRLRKNVND